MRNRNQKSMQNQGREPGMGYQGYGYQGSGSQGSFQGEHRFSGSHPSQWQRPDYEQTQRPDYETSRYNEDFYGPRHLQAGTSGYGGRDMNVDNYSHRDNELDENRYPAGGSFQGDHQNDYRGNMNQSYGRERFGMTQSDYRGGDRFGMNQGNFDRNVSHGYDQGNYGNQDNRYGYQGNRTGGMTPTTTSMYRPGQFGQLGGPMGGYDQSKMSQSTMNEQQQRKQFRGPKGYTRSDERIKEDVSDCLGRLGDIDASDIEVAVKDGEVTLSGTIEQRYHKHAMEDAVDAVSGVKDVINNIRVKSQYGTDVSRDKAMESKSVDTKTPATFDAKAPDDRMSGANNGNRRSNIGTEKHS